MRSGGERQRTSAGERLSQQARQPASQPVIVDRFAGFAKLAPGSHDLTLPCLCAQTAASGAWQRGKFVPRGESGRR